MSPRRPPAKKTSPAAPAVPAKVPGASAVPFGSLDLYERATEEIYRRDYGNLVQIRAGQREFLSFRLGRELYAVDLRGIHEVTRPAIITPVPFAPRWVLGVMMLRGNVVPIFHVGRMLGLSGEKDSIEPAERILLVARKAAEPVPGSDGSPRAADSAVGLLVDEVLEVISVPEEDLGPLPSTVNGPRAEFVVGVARKTPNLYVLLNHQRVARADPAGGSR
jgi:purine-binding chemotaxis protein CheW